MKREIGDRGLSVWAEPLMRVREWVSLKMHQEKKSIRDPIHLMHEEDIYVLKCACPLPANLWPGYARLSSPGCHSLQ